MPIASDLQDKHVSPADSRASDFRHDLPSGHCIETLTTGSGDECVVVRSSEGKAVVTIELTLSGPVVRVEAAELQLVSPGRVHVECDEYAVDAKSRIIHRSGGDIRSEAQGDVVTVAQGDAAQIARTTTIQSARGDVFLKANDDVRLKGERIRLNC